MISRPLTRVVLSTEMQAANPIQAEGACLVRKPAATFLGVDVSAGGANPGEYFVGFSFAGTSAYPFEETTATKVESFLVGVGGTVTLARVPTGEVMVHDLDAATYTAVAANASGQVASLTVGNEVEITYTYVLTAIEAVALRGNTQPGGYSGAIVNQIGVITRGFVMTDQFDASANYAAYNPATNVLVAIANGQVSMSTATAGVPAAGTVIPGVVTRMPDESYPFLGIEFSANA